MFKDLLLADLDHTGYLPAGKSLAFQERYHLPADRLKTLKRDNRFLRFFQFLSLTILIFACYKNPSHYTLKTHPSVTRIRLKGRNISERKEGYAEWQLLEET